MSEGVVSVGFNAVDTVTKETRKVLIRLPPTILVDKKPFDKDAYIRQATTKDLQEFRAHPQIRWRDGQSSARLVHLTEDDVHLRIGLFDFPLTTTPEGWYVLKSHPPLSPKEKSHRRGSSLTTRSRSARRQRVALPSSGGGLRSTASAPNSSRSLSSPRTFLKTTHPTTPKRRKRLNDCSKSSRNFLVLSFISKRFRIPQKVSLFSTGKRRRFLSKPFQSVLRNSSL